MLIDVSVLPIFLLTVLLAGLVVTLLVLGNVFSPRRKTPVKSMPYESGMDPVHDTRRRFDVRFYLVAIAFLVFDVELLFLYPWAISVRGLPRSAPVTVTAAETATDEAAVVSQTGGDVTKTTESNDGASPTWVRPPYLASGGLVFGVLLVLGYVYDWRRGVFQWR
ncbi:MAG: NADH-quinone oxidoreductase subunit A [Planctomycetota bacterium]|nr:MAG: NADH-quinone oxidoreductase subunit A [Planctomycetota bacterium]